MQFLCPTCREPFDLTDEEFPHYAGKKARCPSCRGVMEIPEKPPAKVPLAVVQSPPPAITGTRRVWQPATANRHKESWAATWLLGIIAAYWSFDVGSSFVAFLFNGDDRKALIEFLDTGQFSRPQVGLLSAGATVVHTTGDCLIVALAVRLVARKYPGNAVRTLRFGMLVAVAVWVLKTLFDGFASFIRVAIVGVQINAAGEMGAVGIYFLWWTMFGWIAAWNTAYLFFSLFAMFLTERFVSTESHVAA